MAEAIGIIGSGVVIASFAVEVPQKITEIKGFINSLKTAPEEINLLIEEISILNELLLSVDALPLHSDITNRCGRLCRRAAETLSDILEECKRKLETRKFLGRIEFVLRNDDIEKCIRRLERAKSMLSQAHMYVVSSSASCKMSGDISSFLF